MKRVVTSNIINEISFKCKKDFFLNNKIKSDKIVKMTIKKKIISNFILKLKYK